MFKKPLSFILISSLLLLGCDFRPAHKVIEYQEEVKLSDGSFIWVDIKRHYRLAGEPFQKANYLPSIVEISWDTGFPNVGRQSLSFVDDIYLLDKIDGKWYVIGNTYGQAYDFDNSKLHNCVTSGTYTPRMHISPICLVVLDEKGKYQQMSKGIVTDVTFNILRVRFIDTLSKPPTELNNQKLIWQQKLDLQQHQPEFSRNIGKTYQAYYDPKEYGYE
ncbi:MULTISPECIES: hypothetical protein [Moraxella]|uniref:Lipoprotein n=1 Tax=Moraxella lacunata TaxID=477 RepID=A0A1B8Q7V6_MORLA|nr:MULTISPECIES: hypothetical protein [Moraxella]MBE9579887.1 hypothetical protein [Moraxella sp. K1664]MBE9589261.1 hypothetical protein [Moraxella sp. K1630]MBE9591490.1 hypothetical protein [Moraxella sp. K127]MBE9597520.1 hypothetical protein [Moraxella sp. K2450]MDH9220023.1 hypothetical protein [Moraxella lacunata]